MKIYSGNITSLKDDEVFVFGCNKLGFHGAGAAGFASFGVTGNRWREFDYANKPDGWKGKWNEKGKTLAQIGVKGKSYGLVTIDKTGDKKSLSKKEIRKNILELYKFAKSRPSLKFYVAQSDKRGFNGYEPIEMAELYCGEIPNNIYFEENFAKIIDIIGRTLNTQGKLVKEAAVNIVESIKNELRKN